MKWTEDVERAFKILMFLGYDKIYQLEDYMQENEIINEKRFVVQAECDLVQAMKNRTIAKK